MPPGRERQQKTLALESQWHLRFDLLSIGKLFGSEMGQQGGADERAAWRIAGCAEGLFNIDSMHRVHALTLLNDEVAHSKSLQLSECKLSMTHYILL